MTLHPLRIIQAIHGLRLRTKLIGSFCIVACTTLLTGSIGWTVATKLSNHLVEVGRERLPAVYNLMQAGQRLESIRSCQMAILDPNTPRAERSNLYAIIATHRKKYRSALGTYETCCHTEAERERLDSLQLLLQHWETQSDEFLSRAAELDQLDVANPLALKKNVEQFRGDLYKLQSQVSYLIQTNNSFEGGENPATSAFGKWATAFTTGNTDLAQIIADIIPHHETFYRATAKIKQQVSLGQLQDASLTYFLELIPAADAMFQHYDQLRTHATKAEQVYAAMTGHGRADLFPAQQRLSQLLAEIIRLNDAKVDMSVNASIESARWARMNALVGCLIGTCISIALGICLSFSITRILNRVITGLKQEAGHLASISAAMSTAAAALSDAAHEQSSGFHQTATGMETIAAASENNSRCSNQASEKSDEARTLAAKGNDAMQRMLVTMEQIKTTADQNADINNAIDAIAFKTKVLALNASIEAARASVDGTAFAAVASEFSTLAAQCAHAAKEAARLIAQSRAQADRGVAAAADTARELALIDACISDIHHMTQQILSYSTEQSCSVEQVNAAMNQMRTLVDHTAENAKISATTSRRLSAHAGSLITMVDSLAAIIEGGEGCQKKLGTVQQVMLPSADDSDQDAA